MSLVISEFDCPCCGRNHMNQGTFDRAVIARDYAQVIWHISSGWRCEAYNAEVGSKDTSSHRRGCALDIESRTSRHRYKTVKALMDVGFRRIGIGKTFIHGDDDPDKNPAVIWLN